MKIIFHGAAQEVGKSCIEIQSAGQRYLLDAGIKFIQGGVEYPKYLKHIDKIDALFLSHAHLDHSGALPFFEHENLKCSIYTTNLTWQITKKLLDDSYHIAQIQHIHSDYQKNDIYKVQDDVKIIKYNQEYLTDDKKVKFTYFNSGHIPGGASIFLEIEGKKIFYTADINTQTTNLMVPAEVKKNLGDLDILITENTYGDRRHPDRKLSEKGLLESIQKALQLGGTALVPVFGVGRSQEILMVLNSLPKEVPIYLDGMARTVTELILRSNDPNLNKRQVLKSIFSRVKLVKAHDREKIAKQKGCVIVTTSGMIQGGPSVFYASQLIKQVNNYIILTGYQTKGTRGRSLFEDHLFYHQGKVKPVKCHIRKFDFSAHYGQDAIFDFIKKVPHKNLILQHGDINSLETVRQYAYKNINSKVFLPQIGKVLKF
jgi:putative mRNA 3-end processing factor